MVWVWGGWVPTWNQLLGASQDLNPALTKQLCTLIIIHCVIEG